MIKPNLPCKNCGHYSDDYNTDVKKNNIVCRCSQCNSFIKNLSKTDKYGTKEQQADIWDKTKGRCGYCGDLINPFTVNYAYDHIKPKSLGGSHTIENLRVSCRSCNSQKGNKTTEEYRQYLEKKTNNKHTFYYEIHRPISVKEILFLLYKNQL